MESIRRWAEPGLSDLYNMTSPETTDPRDTRPSRRRTPAAASRVALGIAFSRSLGFLREMALAYFFGAGAHADVFRTALRGPNLLQNLLGEQTLSASFIPVYSRLLSAGREEEAGRFAGAIFGLLLATAATLSFVGVVLAEPIVGLLAPGYLADASQVAAGELSVDRFALAVRAVRIIFPMTGILVLSAWALGILNSHRRFFVSYMAPALWNAAIIAALVLAASRLSGYSWSSTDWSFGPDGQSELVIAACLGALAGGVLQFAIQLPWVLRVLKGFRLSFSIRVAGVKEAIRAFAPLVAGRGAVQISGYLDYFLASFLAAGAVAALGWAQTLYLLPIGLFGMSVAAAELPELARQAGGGSPDAMKNRVKSSFVQMTFLTVPSAIVFLVFGFVIVGALFGRGEFGVPDTWLVYLILAAYSLGLVASTTSRLLNNVFYAMGQTGKPARIAIERVALSAAVGVSLMVYLDRVSVNQILAPDEPGSLLFLGSVGLALGAGVASWYELVRLLSTLSATIGPIGLPWRRTSKLVGLGCLSSLPGLVIWYFLEGRSPVLIAPLVLLAFAVCYYGLTRWAGLAELRSWLGESSKD